MTLQLWVVVDKKMSTRGTGGLFYGLLFLNVTRTKKIVVDFRRTGTMLNTHFNPGETVENYRYLRIHLDNKVDWNCNAKMV